MVKFFKNFKCAGFSMFEIGLTIIITSIMFSTVGIFMAKPMLLFTQNSQQISATSKLNMALRRIANDFSQYAGGINIYSNAANTMSLQFNIPNNTSVTYICDFNAGVVYRQTNIQGSQLLLDNITSCSFRKNISVDGAKLFLNIRMGITKNNMPVVLTEILNAPNI
jgi:type II secretory pathway pseudopilin PulG